MRISKAQILYKYLRPEAGGYSRSTPYHPVDSGQKQSCSSWGGGLNRRIRLITAVFWLSKQGKVFWYTEALKRRLSLFLSSDDFANFRVCLLPCPVHPGIWKSPFRPVKSWIITSALAHMDNPMTGSTLEAPSRIQHKKRITAVVTDNLSAGDVSQFHSSSLHFISSK